MIKNSAVIAFALCFGVPATADETTVDRYFLFRDGSALKLKLVDEQIPLTIVKRNGRIETKSFYLSKFHSVTLTSEEGFERKKKLLTSVQQLGSPLFQLREKAQAVLIKMGAGIRADLEACLEISNNTETRTRLTEILSVLPKDEKKNPTASIAFDRFHGDRLYWGYLGDQPLKVVIQGKTYRLKRKDVEKIITTPPTEYIEFGKVSSAKFRRVSLDQFPEGCIEEGFETDPSGQRVSQNQNVEKLFLKRGFVLSTSITSSYVGVNSYTVQGKSRGNSIATHQPLWQGVITIRFVKPGREDIPRGVNYFGCYVAAVVPNGTSMVAYDRSNREIGKITTTHNNTEFLGIHSQIPIHQVKIIPNEALDRDYTLDDFIFLPASPTESSHPEKITVSLTDGAAFFCKDLQFQNGQTQVDGLPAGLPSLTFAPERILRVSLPQGGELTEQKPLGLYAMLDDGSIIFAKEPKEKRKQPTFERRPGLIKSGNLVGLWSSQHQLRVPPADKNINTGLVWDANYGKWQSISNVRFLEELVLWKDAEQKFAASGYRKLPPLWVQAPPAVKEETWRVVTKNGEALILSPGTFPSGNASKELSISWRKQTIRIPSEEISSVYREITGMEDKAVKDD